MKNILLGLFPALMWGIQPIIMTKLAGRSSQKIMGMALGIFLLGLLVSILRPATSYSGYLIFFSLLDGLALAYGLINQIRGLELLGVSKGIPISTAGQLIGASLVGALYFKEWSSWQQYGLGSLALVLIILGVSMTAYEEASGPRTSRDLRSQGLLRLTLSSLGFVGYTVILRLTNISIWQALLPQGLGVLLGSYLLAGRQEGADIFHRTTLKHIATGLIFALANIGLMLSNVVNGLALGFSLTQMNVVIASLGSLIFLDEKKTRRELVLTCLGLVLVVLGGILIGTTKK